MKSVSIKWKLNCVKRQKRSQSAPFRQGDKLKRLHAALAVLLSPYYPFMKTIFVTLAFIAALMINPGTAEKSGNSANHYLPSCRDFINKHVREAFDLFNEGECARIIEALAFMASDDDTFVGFRSCAPDGVTAGQMVTVVVRWLDRYPQRWHGDFMVLALVAMHEAWPCK